VCWNITRKRLWLLCNVHFVQSVRTGCLCKQKSIGRPLTAEDDVERVRASFLHSPKKSTRTAAKELSMSKTTVWRVLRKLSEVFLLQMFVITENIMKRPLFYNTI
jgi:hypothetical protein